MLNWLISTMPLLTWFELLGLILGVIGVIGLPILAYMRHLYDQRQLVSEDRDDLAKILDRAPEARCWWRDTDMRIDCSRSFASLLGLNLSHPVEIVDVTNTFDDPSAFLLGQAIQNTQQTGEHFSCKLMLLDRKTLLQVEGMRILQVDHGLMVLSVIDITDRAYETQRLTAELKTLRAERHMLQAMIDIVPVALWYRNPENQITFCNRAYAGAIESSPSEVAVEHKELMEASRSTSPYQMAIKVRDTGKPQSQRNHIVIDGSRRLVEMTEIAYGTDATVGYALDVTDQEEMASNLKRHVVAHQEVLHQLSTPIAVFGADTRLEFFNNAYAKLFGYEEAWLYAKPTFADIIQDMRERRKLPEYPDFQAFRQERLQLFKTLLQPLQELVHQPDGQILRLLIAPHPLGGLLFMYDDVTDKLALERQYNTLIAVQKETLDHLYEGIIVLGSDSRLRLSNPAAARFWQVNAADIKPGCHATEILALVQSSFSTEAEWNAFQMRLLTIINQRVPKTGRFERADKSMIQYAYVPLPDGSHLLSFIDVSDRWRFERALQERNQALEQADRIKSNFLSHVSYELKTPLNTVVGFAEILVNQYFGTLNERQADYCRGIINAAQRLLALINDILDLASIEAGQMTLTQHPVQLEAFLSSLVGLVYNRSHDQGLEISYTNESNIQTFIGDERRLKQAVFNLLSNAIKYTPSGGHIELKASTKGLGDKQSLCLSVQEKQPVAWLEVHAENFLNFDTPAYKILERLRRDYPISLHAVNLSVGSSDGVDEYHIQQVKALINRIDPFLVSDHLSWGRIDGYYFNDLLPIPYTQEALEICTTNVSRIQDIFGHTFLIENPSSYLQYNTSDREEAQFLASLTQETGTGILLDVNNIYVSCANHGWDAQSYLQALSSSKVKEIHLAGHATQGSIHIDDHGSAVCDEVWDLYRKTVDMFGPLPTLIEWDTNIPSLDILIKEMEKAQAILDAIRAPSNTARKERHVSVG